MPGKRQPPRPQKRRPSRSRRTFRIAYRMLVALSAAIVGVTVAWKLYIKPPAVTAGINGETAPSFATKAPGSNQPNGGAAAATPEPALQRKDSYYTIVIACKDSVGDNTDTMLVASYDVANQKASLVSIPRDTLVARTMENGNSYRKINSAYANGGGEELKAAVSNYLGIPIDCYVVFNLRGIMKLVDQIGGVDFYVPCDMNYDDPTQDLHIHYEEGMYHGLSGQQVMEICRYRDDNYDFDLGYRPSGYSNYAIGRDETCRNMIKTVAAKLLSLSNADKVKDLAATVFDNLKTDLDLRNVGFFIDAAFGKFDMSGGLSSANIPGDSEVTYKGTPYYFMAYPEEALEIINTMLNPYTTDITEDMADLTPVKVN